jgi:hypothetical protein
VRRCSCSSRPSSASRFGRSRSSSAKASSISGLRPLRQRPPARGPAEDAERRGERRRVQRAVSADLVFGVNELAKAHASVINGFKGTTIEGARRTMNCRTQRAVGEGVGLTRRLIAMVVDDRAHRGHDGRLRPTRSSYTTVWDVTRSPGDTHPEIQEEAMHSAPRRLPCRTHPTASS